MKVQCLIRRPKGTDVELARVIKFRPIDPTREDSPHVADVEAGEAETLFRADARVYVPFEGKAAAPLAAPPAPPATGVPGDANGNGEVSVSELRKMIAKGADKDVLRGLIERENAKPEGERRNSFIDIAQRALD